jgi:hypothetical protein
MSMLSALKKRFPRAAPLPDLYCGVDLNGHDQFGIKEALRYERSHVNDDPEDPLLAKAREIRVEWAKVDLFHTNNGTSILVAMGRPITILLSVAAGDCFRVTGG